MTIAEFVHDLVSDASKSRCIAFRTQIPPRKPYLVEFPDDLPPKLRDALRREGIEQLYSHQRRAWELACDGVDFVVATGTASGKSLCYNMPVLATLLQEPKARALYLFPTKALAQDQLWKLRRLAEPLGVRSATYDGDTPKSERAAIRGSAHIVLTNPDMLHIGILPNYEGWLKFLGGLRFLVIDEMHAYRGIFGSHVALVLRRLLRLCEGHGLSKPRVVACSATIGNPDELVRQLINSECEVITEDGSPSGPKEFLIWNPPEIGGTGERRSANLDASKLLAALVSEGIRSIAFSRARVTAELLLRYARQELDPAIAEKIDSYRGGYTPEERRQIERRLFGGELLGVTATNALELGIDVGGLDAAIVNGYPGNISSLWQQAGRAGRGTEPSAVWYVAHNDPLEQHLVREPEVLLDSRHEHAKINPSNRYVLESQLRCAAYERPLADHELHWFGGSAAKRALDSLAEAGALEYRGGRYYCPEFQSPAAQVDIRSAGGRPFEIWEQNSERVLGTVEEDRAFQVAHPGATYLHRGEQFIIRTLDIENRVAKAEHVEVNYYTEARTEVITSLLEKIAERTLAEGIAAFGAVQIWAQVTGYSVRQLVTERFLDFEPLDLPARTFETLGVWFTFPRPPAEEQSLLLYAMGVHAAEHALATALTVLVACDKGDIGSSWKIEHSDTGRPTVVLFDEAPGGVGICESGFERLGQWVPLALRVLTSCPCDEGCPSCSMTPGCPERNANLDKKQGIARLRSLINGPREGL